VRTAQYLALGVGVIVVIGSTLMKFIEGNITAVTNKTANLLTTPIFGLFFYALFVRFANPIGVWIGTLVGIFTAAAIAFSGPLVYLLHRWFDIDLALFGVEEIIKIDEATGRQWATAADPISFQWISPVSFLVNVIVGTIACWLFSWGSKESKSARR
jgi:SSS family solute:Na+ symporter